MSAPLQKDKPEQELSTADLAPGSRPDEAPADVKEGRPKPVQSERTPGLAGGMTTASKDQETTPLFPNDELEELRNRWKGIQTAFVDEPRRAVEQADGLVASAMKRLAEVFAQERSKLEQHWDRGDNVSTEDLRVALQRYRSFFHRLLSV
jgi:hypothetical protein